ncbi:hypothetical protein FHX08_004546 [Rhizobium sp. BK529]|uniref:hypothetical protein n=1 Tax=unclassified Rhizobium TaxID=2613769 RepID=UPI00104DA734|nr:MULTISPECIES: hypothetical protein [unclassified Rhizobium]MBB3594143.1 hypothetical protein [Rhizobium sp. BK529]TCS01598.1 hypothetical protein EV281_106343 [Rhizobium sp. BK418]
MVEKIAPTAPTAAPSATHINHSTSIGSEPDNAWVAERQAEITAGKEKKGEYHAAASDHKRVDEGDDRAADRHLDHHSAHPHADDVNPDEERLSGESERIGTGNLDEDVPFGDHIGYL